MAELPSMIEAMQRPVLELAEALQGSLLYVDAGAAEIAHTTLGLPFLLGLGVSHVCSLELASPDDAAFPLLTTGHAPTRLAIFTTQLLTDVHQHVLRAVMAHPRVTSVAVHCSVSEHAHACQAASELGVEAYREYGDMLADDVRRARAAAAAGAAGVGGSGSHAAPPAAASAAPSAAAGAVAPGAQQHQLTAAADGAGTGGGSGADGGSAAAPLAVRVSFLPLLACCPDPGLLLLPAASSAALRSTAGGLAGGFGPADAVTADSAAGWAEGGSGGLALTAHALLAVAAALGAGRPEAFPIGPVSAALAAELASLPNVALPQPAGSGGGGPAAPLALVLMDRSLDLAAPSAHGDHPWDLLLAAAAERQAAAALAAVGGPAAAPLPPPPPLAVWRPLDLRVDLPGADPAPLDLPAPLPRPSPAASSSGTSARLPYGGDLYGTLSYDSYGAELLDPADRAALARGEALWGRGRKEALAALRRGLKEALRSEKLAPSVRSKAGVVQAAELRGLAEALLAAPGPAARQRSVAALGVATAAALAGDGGARWEAAAGLERSALAALAGGGGGGEAAAGVLLDALAAAQQGRGLLHVGHVLEVLPAVYSAAPDAQAAAAAAPALADGGAASAANAPPDCPFTPAQQRAVRNALAAALLACSEPAAALAGRLPYRLVAALAARRRRLEAEGGGGEEQPDPGLQRRLGEALDGLFAGLRFAAAARGRLRELKKVTHTDVFAENMGAVNPLIRQVVRRLLQRADLADWQPQAPGGGGGGGGLVRGLLGGLMGASRALVGGAGGRGGGGGRGSPGDFACVLVFVVGGISPAEVRQARAELEEHVGPGKPRLLLGGTSLLLPADVVLQAAGGPLA